MMTLIGRDLVDKLAKKHTDVAGDLQAWFHEAKNATWTSTQDIVTQYPNARVISKNKILFNIKGNHYRLLISINFSSSIIVIEKIATHAEYDKWARITRE
ncbi:type II toxin-antitoxin system HigB family toxin [Candidatus Neomarinimicrobiota bacterium]